MERPISSYPVARAIAVIKLSEDNFKDLHDREKRRGFTFPWFNLRSLYFKDLPKPIPKIRDDTRRDAARVIKSCMPDFKKMGYENPDYNEVEVIHAYDQRIRHSSDAARQVEDIMAYSPKEDKGNENKSLF